MDRTKRIALTAHDAAKAQLVAWAFANERTLSRHALTGTGNTARLLMAQTGLRVDSLRAGPLGGDMELGALVAEGRLDVLVFFMDPLTRKAHDIDPTPILRVAALSQTVVAINEATADFALRSELMGEAYHRPHARPALPGVTQRIDDRRDVA